jgi:hypothetical protein
MKRYHNTRFSRPGERKTVKPYGIEESPNGTVYYLSGFKHKDWHTAIVAVPYSPRVFWLHPTKGFRSQGART